MRGAHCYDFTLAAISQRVRMFLAERGMMEKRVATLNALSLMGSVSFDLQTFAITSPIDIRHVRLFCIVVKRVSTIVHTK